MSLIVDPEWTIQQLRLTYLRKIDDHYGPRIISFPSSQQYHPNPTQKPSTNPYPSHPTPSNNTSIYSHNESADSHIAMSGLNDPAQHPQLNVAYSPTLTSPMHTFSPRPPPKGPSEAFTLSPPPPAHSSRLRPDLDTRAATVDGRPAPLTSRQPAKPPRPGSMLGGGSGLKYTQTIYGPGRTGALGMRVSGTKAPSNAPQSSATKDKDKSSTRIPFCRRTAANSSRPDKASLMAASQSDHLTLAALRRSSSDDAASTLNVHPTLVGRHSLDVPSIPRLSVRGPPEHGSWVTSPPNPQQIHSTTQPARLSPQLNHRELPSIPTDASSEPDTDTTDAGDYSPAAPPVPLPRPASVTRSSYVRPDLQESSQVYSRRRSASTSATDTLAGANRISLLQSSETTAPSLDGSSVADDENDESMQETLEHSDSSAAPLPASKWYPGSSSMLKHLRSDSSLSSLASHPADDTSTPYPLQTSFAPGARLPPLRSSPEGTPRFSRHAFEPAPSTTIEDHTETSFSVPSVLASVATESDIHGVSREPIPSDVGKLTLPAIHTEPDDKEQSNDSTQTAGRPKVATSQQHAQGSKPSTEALIAARSRLRRPSRSHLKAKTLAQRNAERQQKQNAWFQANAIGNAKVAQLHAQPKTSALSAMLQKQSVQPENPFAHFYAAVAGRHASTASSAMKIDVIFPWAAPSKQDKPARSPNGAISSNESTKKLTLSVRKDASMEELIGYGLYCFVEEGWSPALDQDGGDQDVRLSTLGWVLRIVEDGEIDDDYPAIDRSLVVGKFGQDEFAIVEASAQQVKQNEAALSSVQRRASRLTAPLATAASTARPLPSATSGTTPAPAVAGVTGGRLGVGARAGAPVTETIGGNAPAGSLISVAGTPIIASSALGKSTAATGTGIFLRVAVTPNAQVRYKTTLNVPSETYLADVLDLICKKRRLANPDEWAFVVPDDNIVVPLDRTVESLQGSHDLVLVKRSTLGALGGQDVLASQSTNPNASIFKRLSEPAQPRYNVAKDVTATYKSWTVTRKMPMFVGRHERTLTIDGDWIHIIPTDTRAFYAHAASFPIMDVVSCKQSTKLPQSFKLIFSRDNDKKRYDLEAEDSKQAAEIAFEITTRKRAMKR